MRLHTNIKQTNLGLIKSKPGWLFDYRLELTPEEAELVKTYKAGDRYLGEFITLDGKSKPPQPRHLLLPNVVPFG